MDKIGRFDKVYLGCKTDTAAVWPVYVLAFMRLLGYGVMIAAHDPDTGELLPAMHCCGVEVFVVVVGGELLTEVVTYGAQWKVARWDPRYSLHIDPVGLHRSLVVTVLVWWHVAGGSVLFIAGSGMLVDGCELWGTTATEVVEEVNAMDSGGIFYRPGPQDTPTSRSRASDVFAISPHIPWQRPSTPPHTPVLQ